MACWCVVEVLKMPGFDELDGEFNKAPKGCQIVIVAVIFVVLSILRGCGIA